MKYTLFLALILFASLTVPAQQKPLTQAEYVKMLYAIERSPSTKADVIEALRSRGIDFVLTDGLRGLTRSKGGNDAELRRALEQAERRRKDPEGTKLPSVAEADEILSKTRENTLAAVADMPDFVVKQRVERSAAYAGTNNFRNLDNLVVAVSYRSTGQEEYKLLSQNGVLQDNPQAKGTYEEVGGTSSTGEFVTVLATIFRSENAAEFKLVESDILKGKKTFVFEYEVAVDKARQRVTATGLSTETAVTGMKGRLWVDPAEMRVLRLESEATEIPPNFPIRTAKRTIEYDWAQIADERHLLPSLSDVRLTFRDRSKVFETRNLIRFRDYQKYGSEVRIVEEDSEPIEDVPPGQ